MSWSPSTRGDAQPEFMPVEPNDQLFEQWRNRFDNNVQGLVLAGDQNTSEGQTMPFRVRSPSLLLEYTDAMDSHRAIQHRTNIQIEVIVEWLDEQNADDNVWWYAYYNTGGTVSRPLALGRDDPFTRNRRQIPLTTTTWRTAHEPFEVVNLTIGDTDYEGRFNIYQLNAMDTHSAHIAVSLPIPEIPGTPVRSINGVICVAQQITDEIEVVWWHGETTQRWLLPQTRCFVPSVTTQKDGIIQSSCQYRWASDAADMRPYHSYGVSLINQRYGVNWATIEGTITAHQAICAIESFDPNRP